MHSTTEFEHAKASKQTIGSMNLPQRLASSINAMDQVSGALSGLIYELRGDPDLKEPAAVEDRRYLEPNVSDIMHNGSDMLESMLNEQLAIIDRLRAELIGG